MRALKQKRLMMSKSALIALLLTLGISSVPAYSAPVKHTDQLNCRIEPSVEVEMSSAVEGVVSEVLVDKNDRVKKAMYWLSWMPD